MALTIGGGKWRMATHLAHLDRELLDIAAGRNDRLIVEMPPRHGKSELTSRYFPAWYLGNFPDRDVILCSATDSLAKQFSRAGRELIEEHGKSLFGVGLRSDSRSVEHWHVSGGGSLRAAGVGGGIMGQGAHVLIIDDFFKNVEEALSPTTRDKLAQWFHSTSSTRLMPGGAIIMVATRWHHEDLIGLALRDAGQGGDQWRRVCFPAIAGWDGDALMREPGEALWPTQWPVEDLERRKRSYEISGYPWMWDALYQQEPPETLDATWPPELFRGVGFDHWPEPHEIQFTVIALDPSMGKTDKSDFSAYVVLKLDNEGVMWVDADLDRRDPVRTVEAGFRLAREHEPLTLGVEINGFQGALDPLFAAEGRKQGFGVPFHGINNGDNKQRRIMAGLSPWLHNRALRFRNNSPGTALLLEQLRGFPSHKHDDGPDALEMAIRLAQGIHSGKVTA